MKYKNIVFDMGNVLIDYVPENVIKQYTDNPELIKKIKTSVFSSMEWLLLDAGLISEKEALEQILERFDNDYEKDIARLSFLNWDRFNMLAKPGMQDLIIDLKKKGYRVYILSNASLRLPKVYMNYLPAPTLYDGVFFSACYKLLKPQKEIYQTFLQTFHLVASQCLFIDDMERNVSAAMEEGFGGYRFDGDVHRLNDFFHDLESL